MPTDPVRERLDRLREHPLARALAEAAAPSCAWLVGGALRDAVLGDETTSELDAVVERDAARVADRLARALPARLVRLGGERFSAFRLIAPSGSLDLRDLDGAALSEDLERRDFTINAVALGADGATVDPHGGLADLAARRLRATRPGAFAEDPLRVLRLARFLVTLPGFRAEEECGRGAREAAPGLARVAGERIREELARIWEGSAYAPAFAALAGTSAWPLLWLPVAAGAPGALSPIEPAELVDRTLAAGPLPDPLPAGTRVACGHALAARSAAGSGAFESLGALARRAALSTIEHRTSRRLLELSTEPPPADDPDLAWLLHRSEGLGAHVLALAAAFDPERNEAAWGAARRRADELLALRGAEILSPRPLLSGTEIARALDVPPGPELGRLVAALREAQVRGEVGNRAQALARLGEIGARRTP